jgi:hypothetical protein
MSRTVFSVSGWTRHDVAATPETVLSMLTEAYLSCTFGNSEPPLLRMGKGFWGTMLNRLSPADQDTLGECFKFMGARVIVDDRFDSWMCHIYIWDRERYELPILFVGATVRLVDGQ